MGVAPLFLAVISITSPATSVVTTPVHFAASAEGARAWTLTNADGRPLYKTDNPTLDGWVVLPQRKKTQNVTVTAMADGKPIGSQSLTLTVWGVALPPPSKSTIISTPTCQL